MSQDFFASLSNKNNPQSYKEKCHQLIANGYDVNFSSALTNAFSLLGKKPVAFMGFSALYIFLVGFVSLIPVFGGIGQLFFSTPLLVGIYLVARNVQEDTYAGFSQFFDGFSFLGQLALQSLLITTVILVLEIAMIVPIGVLVLLGFIGHSFSMADIFNPIILLLGALLSVPLLYVFSIYIFAPFLVIFANMRAWEAMEMSRKIAQKSMGIFILLLFAFLLLMLFGVLFFFVGIFVAFPVALLLTYSLFDQIVGAYKK